MDAATEPPAWHQALVYVLTGQRYPELGRQDRPDVAVVAAFLADRSPEVVASPPTRPYPLPPELAAGLGPAQLGAAVAALRVRLAHDRGRVVAPVVADRPLSADEQRLLREVPPHHGS